jgi:hypothetical protein
MINDLRKQREMRKAFLSYSSKIELLTGSKLNQGKLLDIEKSEDFRKKSNLYLSDKTFKTVVNFSEKLNEKFKALIEKLHNANPSPIYIWLEDSNTQGLYKVCSLKSIDFSFPFNIDTNGVIVFRTEDLNEKMLMDFFYDDDGEEMLEIELQGNNWPQLSQESFGF